MYYLAKIIQKILLKLPLVVSLFLAKIIGYSLYFNRRKRSTAFRNLKLAFPRESRRKIHAILHQSFYNFSLGIIENLIAPRIYKYVTTIGTEHMGSDGGIYVTIHAGNWEVSTVPLAQRYKYAVFVKPQKNKPIDRFLNELRDKTGIKICFSLKELIKCLKQDYLIGMVVDQGAEKDAPDVSFFSHLVPTPQGAVYLAKKFNKKIYPAFSYRQKGFNQTLKIGKPIETINKDTKEILTYLNKLYQEYLEEHPAEYFWNYKRFKYKKDKTVIILSDGKVGHIKQSQAVLASLKENTSLVESEIVEVKYKNKLMRILAEVCAFFSGKHCQGCGRCLFLLLDKNTRKKLDSLFADIVISTGSAVAPINKLFSSYLGSKSVVILRPNLPLSKFDLTIVPEHDDIKGANTAVIKGALFYPQDLENKVSECQDFFKLSKDKKIALFIGGPLNSMREFFANLRIFILQLQKFCLKENFKMLISTSRRTPKDIEKYLKQELNNFANIEALVLANQNNYNFVFEGFNILSDIVFVSSESISMLSEAASLGKSCVSVSLERQDNRHRSFLASMSEDISFLSKPYNLEELNLKTSLIREKNKIVLKEALKKIL
ncbi:MAG: mitochondrial fission ELM1 family protein [Candidatus Omnitrophica bacterium]|jgi:lauroyl/myristoyl acyltransferase|nr:mitochondrial fission ELM1 family protein [Candidatus Omnitrophota bacterium]